MYNQKTLYSEQPSLSREKRKFLNFVTLLSVLKNFSGFFNSKLFILELIDGRRQDERFSKKNIRYTESKIGNGKSMRFQYVRWACRISARSNLPKPTMRGGGVVDKIAFRTRRRHVHRVCALESGRLLLFYALRLYTPTLHAFIKPVHNNDDTNE